MKQYRLATAVVFAVALSIGVQAAKTKGSPLAKVITLMTQLQGQVIREGEMSHTSYKKYSAWCEKSSREKQFEIKEGISSKADLEATIDKAKTDGEEAEARIGELSGMISTDESDVKAITLIRYKEKQEFEAMDKELADTVKTISKARSVLTKELSRAGLKAGSFLQRPTKGMQVFAAALQALVTTSMGVSADTRERLSALLQTPGENQQSSEDVDDDKGDEEVSKALDAQSAQDDEMAKEAPVFLQEDEEDGAGPVAIAQPKAPVYESKSGGILKVLEDMENEAQKSQDKERKKEGTSKYNFDALFQRLQDRLKTQNKELNVANKAKASAAEDGSTAKGKLDAVVRDLGEDKKMLKKLQQGCLERASEFEIEVKTRGDELTAIASAKKTVQAIALVQVQPKQNVNAEEDGDPDASAMSFAQTDMEVNSEAHQRAWAMQQAGTSVITQLKQLATDEHSVALAQLSSRISRVMTHMKTKGLEQGADPFEKVRRMIQNMITKLEDVQKEAARQKAFCDKEMKETEESMKLRKGTVGDLSTNLDKGTADTDKMKGQVTTLLAELGAIEKSQGEMDEMRRSETAAYKKVNAEQKGALAAVQTALKVLRDFYSAGDDNAALIQDMGASMKSENVAATQGAGGGTAIIGLLEICESDFSKAIAEGDSEEDAAQGAYSKFTHENKKDKAVKDKTVQLLGGSIAKLGKKMSEYTGDRTQTQQELDALIEYMAKLTKQCVAQPENYAVRAARRKREITGLEDALQTLNQE